MGASLQFTFVFFSVLLTVAKPDDQCNFSGAGAHSQWVYPEGNRLGYRPLNSDGDRIMDFSAAGYHGGGVALPSVPVKARVPPSGSGDDTESIQSAINTVSQLPMDQNGLRGAVLLSRGEYAIKRSLEIGASGVVLRGSGTGPHGTILQFTCNHSSALVLRGASKLSIDKNAEAKITDPHVPAGATSFSVDNSKLFQVGDAVIVSRPVTEEWLHFMKMDNLTRWNKQETWLSTSTQLRWKRTISSIVGNRISIDVPLSDSIDTKFLRSESATIAKYSETGGVENVGVEHLEVKNGPNCGCFLATLNNFVDGWMENVAGYNFGNGVVVGGNARRITLRSVALFDANPETVQCKQPGTAEFAIGGSQILLDRCSSTGARNAFYVVTEALAMGPNVVLNFSGKKNAPGSASMQPHQRWATGFLIDGAQVEGRVDFINRNILGSGHGWTVGWGVVWNSVFSKGITVQQPPGSMNWVIGTSGKREKYGHLEVDGIYDSSNRTVTPKSLYLAQLCERLGPQGVKNIGY